MADGRRGACIDITQTVQRFLERQGIWVYFAGGSLRIDFPSDSGLPSKWFWPIMHAGNPARMGHAWACAPPFRVVDLSFSVQPYGPNEQQYLKGYVLAEGCTAAEEITIDDLMENEARAEFQRYFRRAPTLEDLPRIGFAAFQQILADFPSCSVSKGQVRLKYTTTSISGPDRPLEQMRNLCLRGRYPSQLYDEFVRGLEI